MTPRLIVVRGTSGAGKSSTPRLPGRVVLIRAALKEAAGAP